MSAYSDENRPPDGSVGQPSGVRRSAAVRPSGQWVTTSAGTSVVLRPPVAGSGRARHGRRQPGQEFVGDLEHVRRRCTRIAELVLIRAVGDRALERFALSIQVHRTTPRLKTGVPGRFTPTPRALTRATTLAYPYFSGQVRKHLPGIRSSVFSMSRSMPPRWPRAASRRSPPAVRRSHRRSCGAARQRPSCAKRAREWYRGCAIAGRCPAPRRCPRRKSREPGRASGR